MGHQVRGFVAMVSILLLVARTLGELSKCAGEWNYGDAVFQRSGDI